MTLIHNIFLNRWIKFRVENQFCRGDFSKHFGRFDESELLLRGSFVRKLTIYTTFFNWSFFVIFSFFRHVSTLKTLKISYTAIYEHKKFGHINGALLESDAESNLEASGGVFVDSTESESPGSESVSKKHFRGSSKGLLIA